MKRKLRLNRDTILHLTPIEITAAQGGAIVPLTQDRSCQLLSCHGTCVISCAGTCFEISCIQQLCG